MGVDVDYALRPNVKVTGRFDYATADYNSVSGGNRFGQYFAKPRKLATCRPRTSSSHRAAL
jgi:hypothetical protein